MTSLRQRIPAPALATLTAAALGAVLAGCGSSDPATSGDTSDGGTVTLVTHDSFNVSDEVLQRFTEQTGLEVEVLRGGDAGTVVNQAILTKDNPQGDVLFGVDNTLLSRALDEGVFAPYEAAGLDGVRDDLTTDDRHRVTPVDYGDVCVNYDRSYFAEHDLAVPTTFDDLADPAYRDLLVVQNPATSSPGLAFLLGTVAEYGQDGWQDYWSRLADNGVEVVDGWEEAYNTRFSGAAGSQGDRPLVVSYASSPPAEVIYAETKPDQAPTGVVTGTCFRQVEYAGLLEGAANPEGGQQLIDFLLSDEFQRDMPLQMFVNPAVDGTELPEEFTAYSEQPERSHSLDPALITENRDQWIEDWTGVVLR
ncbi:thiamine ABC transporter substrate-binding protein [Allostreptomyces psammosilenae]|uniref:Thiamine transport system substrate-binding protein n=1 Tax=Allostreptomyces psammosilenae TaxID=1892865 RepID=A0A853A1F6_9ACTN|nr:thiamine ABC transporter substrate-binding protein [Allostreptomyces psammosilenae]NYI08396.1 thiamine transport system substrate-binding protein [Allostreptomyces psammosilenae]